MNAFTPLLADRAKRLETCNKLNLQGNQKKITNSPFPSVAEASCRWRIDLARQTKCNCSTYKALVLTHGKMEYMGP